MLNLFKKIKISIKNKKGYALLFAVVITSIISVIVAGLSNLVYKQMILTSLVKDSQSAFYMADTATECALYANLVKNDSLGSSPWSCGIKDFNNSGLFDLTVSPHNADESYTLTLPNMVNSSEPCIDMNIDKSIENKVSIKSRGYNMCNKGNIRTVQREIEVKYDLN